jgi:aspartokinase
LETSASYWEARVKTYGFQKVKELCLFDLVVDRFQTALLGHALHRLGEMGITYLLTFSRTISSEFSLSFVISRHLEIRVRDHLHHEASVGGNEITHRVTPIEVVFFHGPHFGDRYGIAETAFGALADNGIQVIAGVCSGSCVYLVTPEGGAEDVVRVLSGTFEIPKAPSRKGSGADQG